MTEETNEQSKPSPLGVCILPWAGLRKEVQIGPVRFWPWDETKVPDQNARNQLGKFFNCFVDYFGKPVETITVCSHGQPDFRLLSNNEEDQDLHSAIDILIFASIAPQVKHSVAARNNILAPPSSDRYQIITQKITPGEKMISLRTGDFGGGFWSLDKVNISQPWGMGGGFGTEPDSTLITAFSHVFENSFPLEVKERIFRSLEWFRLAHTEAEQISIFSKVVMMGTAFEVLLDFPDGKSKSLYFIQQIEAHIKKDNFIMREQEGVDHKMHNYSLAGWWGWDFYRLRNSIVHGDKMDKERLRFQEGNWITHSIVADLVFLQFVKLELLKNGCFSENAQRWKEIWESLPDKPFKSPEKSSQDLQEILFENIIDFDDVHRSLGWIPKKEEGTTNGREF
jgi:hypothetical protein